jgi:hypothetical protein
MLSSELDLEKLNNVEVREHYQAEFQTIMRLGKLG